MNSYSKASVFRLISLCVPVFSLSMINIPNQLNWKPRLWLDFRNNICFDDEMCWELIHVAHAGTVSQTPATTMRVRWALSTLGQFNIWLNQWETRVGDSWPITRREPARSHISLCSTVVIAPGRCENRQQQKLTFRNQLHLNSALPMYQWYNQWFLLSDIDLLLHTRHNPQEKNNHFMYFLWESIYRFLRATSVKFSNKSGRQKTIKGFYGI